MKNLKYEIRLYLLLPNSPTSPSVAVTEPITVFKGTSATVLKSYAGVSNVGELSLMLLRVICKEEVSDSCPSDTDNVQVKVVDASGSSTSYAEL